MNYLSIENRRIGPEEPAYVIAELSANHHHDIDVALNLIDVARECGADAVKIQTYTADTMTLNCKNEFFKIGKGTIWEGKNLYQLYEEAYTPWEWTSRLMEHARSQGIALFSTPFDASSVDYLESCGCPAYKVASFELVDLPLLKKIAGTGKPVIMSTGMASLTEIAEAVSTLREHGCKSLALLKCTSSYPAPPEEANLARIRHMQETFNVPVGLSDHTMGGTVPAVAIALGACIIEKHLTSSRKIVGPDSSFSMEPSEFSAMVKAVRIAEKAVGSITYELTEKEAHSRIFRRSIFAVDNIAKGEILSAENCRIIRPGYGLAPKYWDLILGKRAATDITRGEPLDFGKID